MNQMKRVKVMTASMDIKKYDAVIYVDGSYDDRTKSYAYGMVVWDKNGAKYFKEAFPEDNKTSMRNVAGEITGAMTAMQYASDKYYKNIMLVYDYKGIEEWCTGAWKTNKDATKAYKQHYDKISASVSIDFKHVDGHTGDEGNEICDSLAKSALGLPDKKISQEPYKSAVAKAVPCVTSLKNHSSVNRYDMTINEISSNISSMQDSGSFDLPWD